MKKEYTLGVYLKKCPDGFFIIPANESTTLKFIAEDIISQIGLEKDCSYLFISERGEVFCHSENTQETELSLGMIDLKQYSSFFFIYNDSLEFTIGVLNDGSEYDKKTADFDNYDDNFDDSFYNDFLDTANNDEMTFFDVSVVDKTVEDILTERKNNSEDITRILKYFGKHTDIMISKRKLAEKCSDIMIKNEGLFDIITQEMTAFIKNIKDEKTEFSYGQYELFLHFFGRLEMLGIFEVNEDDDGMFHYCMSREAKDVLKKAIVDDKMNVMIVAESLADNIMEIYGVIEKSRMYEILSEALTEFGFVEESAKITENEFERLIKKLVFWKGTEIMEINSKEIISLFGMFETRIILNEREKNGLDYEKSVIADIPVENLAREFQVSFEEVIYVLSVKSMSFYDDLKDNIEYVKELIKVCFYEEQLYAEMEKFLMKYGIQLDDEIKQAIYELWYEYPTPTLMGRSRREYEERF